jgi:hypothetical protein
LAAGNRQLTGKREAYKPLATFSQNDLFLLHPQNKVSTFPYTFIFIGTTRILSKGRQPVSQGE